VSVKNPYIDDFMVVCNNSECERYVDAASLMNSQANAIAIEEHRKDEYFRNYGEE
jgi:hypothetical protein